LFWLGLAVVALQVTVWIWFLRTNAYVAWYPNSHSEYGFGWGKGAVVVSAIEIGGVFSEGLEYNVSSLEPDREVDFFAPFFDKWNFDPPIFQSGRGFTVAHWAIVLVEGSLWISAMIWNQRRKRRWLEDQRKFMPQAGADGV